MRLDTQLFRFEPISRRVAGADAPADRMDAGRQLQLARSAEPEAPEAAPAADGTPRSA